jgi:hypothetical protein
MQTCHHGNTIELRIISQNGKIIGTVSQKDWFYFLTLLCFLQRFLLKCLLITVSTSQQIAMMHQQFYKLL